MDDEKVSVVMCTYNGEAFVAEQLESILNQTYTALEIIIADDASTDGTYHLLKTYAAQDERIILYQREKNAGYNVNFSEACSSATGSFIAIADQDDVWEEKKIEKLVTKINEHNDTIMVHAISARFEEKGKPHLRSLKMVNYFRGNDIRIFFLSNYISGHSMLFRRSLLKNALPFPPEVYYDWWLAVQACVHGRIDFVNEILVWHRVHQTNATGAAKPKIFFYEQVQTILPIILNIKGIDPKPRELGEKMLEIFHELPGGKFSWNAFRFLMKNAPVIFSYKKRIFPWISYIKHAWRYSKRSTRA